MSLAIQIERSTSRHEGVCMACEREGEYLIIVVQVGDGPPALKLCADCKRALAMRLAVAARQPLPSCLRCGQRVPGARRERSRYCTARCETAGSS